MGRWEKRKSNLPENLSDSLVEILSITESKTTSSTFVGYTEEELNEARLYLRKSGRRRWLLRLIEEELKKRIVQRETISKKTNKLMCWFEPRWNAVRALYGKGPYDIKQKETQELLDSIDPDWVNNCKGEV